MVKSLFVPVKMKLKLKCVCVSNQRVHNISGRVLNSSVL